MMGLGKVYVHAYFPGYFYSFMMNIMTLSTFQIIQRGMKGLLVNEELE
jgi:hypothetical protein